MDEWLKHPKSKSAMKRIATMSSGKLKDHFANCDECDGEGVFQVDDPGDPENFYAHEPCDACDGTGKVCWGSWYFDDITECTECKEEKPCGNMNPAEPEGWWICFDCYVEEHRKQCGCELWRQYEKSDGEDSGRGTETGDHSPEDQP